MYLFSQQHEELVGVYASQLARHLCVDLFVQMMELRLNSRFFSFSLLSLTPIAFTITFGLLAESFGIVMANNSFCLVILDNRFSAYPVFEQD